MHQPCVVLWFPQSAWIKFPGPHATVGLLPFATGKGSLSILEGHRLPVASKFLHQGWFSSIARQAFWSGFLHWKIAATSLDHILFVHRPGHTIFPASRDLRPRLLLMRLCRRPLSHSAWDDTLACSFAAGNFCKPGRAWRDVTQSFRRPKESHSNWEGGKNIFGTNGRVSTQWGGCLEGGGEPGSFCWMYGEAAVPIPDCKFGLRRLLES